MPPKKKTNKRNKSVGASRGHGSETPTRRQGGNITSRNRQEITANRKKGFAGGKRPYDYAFYEKEEATPEYMARLFQQYEFHVSKRELELYWAYYLLLRQRNAALDLTRIMGIEATVLKHFIDSAILADMIDFPGPLLDIGTGPGFPGVPIAIRKPHLQVILAESRGKRVQFLEELCGELGLKNAIIFSKSVRSDSPFVPVTSPTHRLPAKPPYPVGSVVSRALEVIPSTLARVQPFLPAGGKVIFMKGPNCGQEVTDAQQGFKGIYKMSDDIHYDLPGSKQNRRLVVFERRGE